MKAMIFAAGLGTRLKPLTDTMPKALVPLAGKPLLQWQVERLRDAGITDIVVNVHHFPDQIIETIRQHAGWGCDIVVSDERDCLLETGGGLKRAIKEGPVLACNVDVLSNIDLRTFVAEYEKTGISRLVVSERTTQRYLCFNAQDRLCGWTNIATDEVKPSAIRTQLTNLHNLAFSGMQILSKEVLAHLAQYPKDQFSLIEFYLSLCEKGFPMLQAYVPADYRMMDVGKINQIAEAEAFAASLL